MKFSCQKVVLQNAIAISSRAVSGKSPIPALEGLLIRASVDVTLTGYDLKKGIYTNFAANVAQEGSVILGARLFGEIIRSMPEGIVTITADSNNMTTIVCGNSEFSIMGIDANDYPELPEIDVTNQISLEQRVLKSMISETVFAVSDNESRPIYTGSLFEVENDELTMVSVDGFRLALRREAIDKCDVDQCSFVVPGAALTELEKICSETEEAVRITIGSKHISFVIGETVLISRRLEGDFLNYKKSIPAEFSVEVTCERQELLDVVDRVSLIIDEKNKNPLRCVFEENEIRLFCVTPLGKAEDVCLAEGDGSGLEIGFNNRYLRDALRAAPAERILVCLNSDSSPCVILPEENKDNFIYMVLPVRLKASN